jgi:hypothetical protein
MPWELGLSPCLLQVSRCDPLHVGRWLDYLAHGSQRRFRTLALGFKRLLWCEQGLAWHVPYNIHG